MIPFSLFPHPHTLLDVHVSAASPQPTANPPHTPAPDLLQCHLSSGDLDTAYQLLLAEALPEFTPSEEAHRTQAAAAAAQGGRGRHTAAPPPGVPSVEALQLHLWLTLCTAAAAAAAAGGGAAGGGGGVWQAAQEVVMGAVDGASRSSRRDIDTAWVSGSGAQWGQ
jgi:hypothetical protein